jgi:hypothetical protein
MAGRPVQIWHRFVPESLVAFIREFHAMCAFGGNAVRQAQRQQAAYNRAIVEAEQKYRTWTKGKLQDAQRRLVEEAEDLAELDRAIPVAREALRRAIWELLKDNAAYAEALKTQIADDPSALHHEDKTYAEYLGLI